MAVSGIAGIRWAKDAAEIVELGAFFARNAVKHSEYISHGEIQFGLSRDGVGWDRRAQKLITAHFEQLRQGRLPDKVAGAWIEARPVAVAVVRIIEREGLKYVILNDILVEKDSRLKGLGERIVRFIEADMCSQHVDWLFLESGVRNRGAHRFFERLGYQETSRIFAKRLSRRRVT